MSLLWALWISQREGASVWQMFDTWNPAGPLAEWNQDKSMQSRRCLGEMGTKGHSLPACLPACLWELLARILNTRSLLLLHAWYGRQLTDLKSAYIALRSLQTPYKELGQKCSTNLTTANVMNGSAFLLRRVHNKRFCLLSAEPRWKLLSCHFLLGQTCPEGATGRCTFLGVSHL